jgi:hypothetical protein
MAMAWAPAVTQAAPYPFLKVAATGTPGSSVSQPFDDACGLAVDESARLFVSDYHHGLVARFGTELFPPPPSEPELVVPYQSKFVSTEQENSPCAIAADSSGDVFAANFHQGVVRYPAAGAPQAIAPGHATGLAVDRATGTLYVTYRDHVAAYSAPVTPLSVPISIGLGSLGDAYGAAVSGFAATAGYLYVADATDDTVKVFDPAADPVNPVATIDGAATPPGEFRELADASLAVDDNSGDIFVLDNLQPGFEHPAAAVYGFRSNGGYLGRLPKGIVHGGPSGLAIDNSAADTRGLIYVTSGNEIVLNPSTQQDEGSQVYAFCPRIPASVALALACPDPTPALPLEVIRAGNGAGSVTGTGAQIQCGVLCATEADQGAIVTLVATPKPHSAFSGWTVTGGSSSCGTAPICKLTLSSAAQVTATFAAIPQRQLTVTTTGSGSLTSSPVGLDCGATCVAGFDQGTVVTLHPEPGPGAEFTGWSGACGGTGVCKVALSADASVGAFFKPIERVAPIPPGESLRVLAISVGGEGAGTITSDPAGIECGTPCSVAYPPGQTVTLSATPNPESRFVGWSGCDLVAAGRCTVTLATSRTVGAAFAEAKPRKTKPCRKKQSGKNRKGSKCKGARNGKAAGKGRGRR